MHLWGDKDVDWDGINDAADYIGLTLRKWRVPVRGWKEKYGTVRVECDLGWASLHDITHPGHCYMRYRSKLLIALSNAMSRAWWWRPVFHLSRTIHKRVYRRVYRNAVRRWPHLAREILDMADHQELLHGLANYEPWRINEAIPI
jgi:hypothetical protein